MSITVGLARCLSTLPSASITLQLGQPLHSYSRAVLRHLRPIFTEKPVVVCLYSSHLIHAQVFTRQFVMVVPHIIGILLLLVTVASADGVVRKNCRGETITVFSNPIPAFVNVGCAVELEVHLEEAGVDPGLIVESFCAIIASLTHCLPVFLYQHKSKGFCDGRSQYTNYEGCTWLLVTT